MSDGFDSAAFLRSVSTKPGVYRMYDQHRELLYVGKAKNLKSRLSSYFRENGLAIKTRALVARIAAVDITVTHSETEALLLEQNLIKQHRPPYNILMRDDKSYPYIFVSEHDFPLLVMRRGRKNKLGRYYGPFPSGYAVRESIGFLQKTFRLRNCEDSYFANRSRPCLQHQIGRCTAPCVGLISPAEYQADLRHAELFLQGNNQQLLTALQQEMDVAAQELAFERAAALRDQLQHLRKVQEHQSIEAGEADLDFFAVCLQQGVCAVQINNIRQGRMLGSQSFYPDILLDESPEYVLEVVVSQYYLLHEHELPDEIVLDRVIESREVLAGLLTERKGRQVKVAVSVRTDKSAWLKLAVTNAEEAVRIKLRDKAHIHERYAALQQALGLHAVPSRMECFDISHTQGDLTVASCVVFDQSGPVTSDYRRFNIEGIPPGDDYAAMRQVLQRRFRRGIAEDNLPQLLVIDGGKGQMGIAEQVLRELGVVNLPILGVAKGPTRKAGLEELFIDGQPVVIDSHSPALHLIQHIRDESHRFAIAGHRHKRGKAKRQSTLEGIDGVGPKRRRELIRFFGGIQEIKSASVDELVKVPGISQNLAQIIYDALHE